ncbi:cell division protein FtsQ/DivIB [Janibacter massiliensis]|uniref:cell division protein FtsQ/DivIB n=1 Tax=Janibacter massiliensis TaxID=2058291 RepID=UPI000D0E7CD8|nr:FtsQ-type POTRA domain-containing protein [Janibacter massiliensis]
MSRGTASRATRERLAAARSTRERFEERADAVRRRRRLQIGGGLTAVLVLLGVAWLLLASPFLRVERVEVLGAQQRDVPQVRAVVDDQIGRPMALVDRSDLVDALEAEPTVARAEVSRAWPHGLRVVVTPREPVLAVRRVVAGKAAVDLVDGSGAVVRTERRAPKGLPTVAADRRSDELSARSVKAALSVIESLPPSITARVGEITLGTADQVSFTVGPTTVIWGTGDDAALKSDVVRTLLRGRPKVIDVSAPRTPVTR